MDQRAAAGANECLTKTGAISVAAEIHPALALQKAAGAPVRAPIAGETFALPVAIVGGCEKRICA